MKCNKSGNQQSNLFHYYVFWQTKKDAVNFKAFNCKSK